MADTLSAANDISGGVAAASSAKPGHDGAEKGPGMATRDPLAHLEVHQGLSDRDLTRLAAAVGRGMRPRVRLLPSAGQVAGQRGRVMAVADRRPPVAEFIYVQMDRDGDTIPFAPNELRLMSPRDPQFRHYQYNAP